MFDLDVAALAQAGAVGIALGMVMVGGFVAYKVSLRLIGAAEKILTNHLHDLTTEIKGMRKDVSDGFTRVEVALAGAPVKAKKAARSRAGQSPSAKK